MNPTNDKNFYDSSLEETALLPKTEEKTSKVIKMARFSLRPVKSIKRKVYRPTVIGSRTLEEK